MGAVTKGTLFYDIVFLQREEQFPNTFMYTLTTAKFFFAYKKIVSSSRFISSSYLDNPHFRTGIHFSLQNKIKE